MSRHSGRCRGGPYHNQVVTDFDGFQVYKKKDIAVDPGGITGINTVVTNFGTYWWILNPDTNKEEWIWSELHEKKKKEWYQRQKAKKSLMYLQNLVLSDLEGLSHIQILAKQLGLDK